MNGVELAMLCAMWLFARGRTEGSVGDYFLPLNLCIDETKLFLTVHAGTSMHGMPNLYVLLNISSFGSNLRINVEGAVSAQKLVQGAETETRELQEGREEKRVSPPIGDQLSGPHSGSR